MTAPDPDSPSRARAVLLAITGVSPTAADAGELALVLAEELLSAQVDCGRLAARWVALRDDGTRRDSTAGWLTHLAIHQRPPGAVDPVATLVGLPLAVPVALATFRTPHRLLTMSYHAARLTSRDEVLAWGAVGIAVATARFLLDKGDFIPDVLEALAVNDAPAALRDAVRKVPLLPPEPSAGGVAGPVDPVAGAVTLALWAAYRCPAGEPAVAWLDRAGVRDDALVAAAGLLAARDGEPRLPRGWLPDGGLHQRCHELAVRLADPTPVGIPR